MVLKPYVFIFINEMYKHDWDFDINNIHFYIIRIASCLACPAPVFDEDYIII